jgi:fructose-bisphosphate aldolase, class II
MLLPMSALTGPARAGGYAVGSFDVNNLETAAAVLEAAVEKQSPVIIAIPEFGARGVVSMETLFRHVALLAMDYPVPVALILDHGRSLEAVVKAIRSGASAVMLDASTRPFEENVAMTRQAAEIAHWAGVTAEGEIGHVGQGNQYATGIEDLRKLFTQPDQAAEFVERTCVDALAVAIGTAHGHYSGTPVLDFELLARLRDRIATPLVLHGGSSSGDENLARACKLGVAKVNIYTDMATAARDRVKSTLAADPNTQTGRLLNEIKAGFKEVSGHYMDVFGSTGKAAAAGKKKTGAADGDDDFERGA